MLLSRSTRKNVGCDTYQSEGLLLSLLSAVCSQRETNLPLVCINILARASQPTWSSSIIQRLFLLSFPRLLSSSSPFKYTTRFCHLRSQAYHNCTWKCATEKRKCLLTLPPRRRNFLSAIFRCTCFVIHQHQHLISWPAIPQGEATHGMRFLRLGSFQPRYDHGVMPRGVYRW